MLETNLNFLIKNIATLTWNKYKCINRWTGKQKNKLVHIYVNSALWPLTFENCQHTCNASQSSQIIHIFSLMQWCRKEKEQKQNPARNFATNSLHTRATYGLLLLSPPPKFIQKQKPITLFPMSYICNNYVLQSQTWGPASWGQSQMGLLLNAWPFDMPFKEELTNSDCSDKKNAGGG